jgi:hypothetical protein
VGVSGTDVDDEEEGAGVVLNVLAALAVDARVGAGDDDCDDDGDDEGSVDARANEDAGEVAPALGGGAHLEDVSVSEAVDARGAVRRSFTALGSKMGIPPIAPGGSLLPPTFPPPPLLLGPVLLVAASELSAADAE